MTGGGLQSDREVSFRRDISESPGGLVGLWGEAAGAARGVDARIEESAANGQVRLAILPYGSRFKALFGLGPRTGVMSNPRGNAAGYPWRRAPSPDRTAEAPAPTAPGPARRVGRTRRRLAAC